MGRPSLDSLELSRQQLRAVLLRIRYRRQSEVARRMGVSQSVVSYHLAAAVERYPSIAQLVYPAGRCRKQRLGQLAA